MQVLQQKYQELKNLLVLKDQQMVQKKHSYERIITQLQQQNLLLKMYAGLNNGSSKNKSSQFEANDQFTLYSEESDKVQKQFFIRENMFLKKQITEISQNYQRQIEQLTFYFEKVRKLYNQKGTQEQKDKVQYQLQMLKKSYELIVQHYSSQTQLMINKIQEVSKYLQNYEQKFIELSQQNQELKNKIQKISLQCQLLENMILIHTK